MQGMVGSFPGARSASPLSSSLPASTTPMRKVAVAPPGTQVYAGSPQAPDPAYVRRDPSNRSVRRKRVFRSFFVLFFIFGLLCIYF